jgi:hypothetical protein
MSPDVGTHNCIEMCCWRTLMRASASAHAHRSADPRQYSQLIVIA